MKHLISRLTIVLLSLVLSSAAQVTGSGNPGRIPVWTGSTSPSSTLGNSEIFQTGGKLGIRNSTPTATVDIKGPSGSPAPMVFKATGGSGIFGSSGGGLQLVSGNGGAFLLATGGTGAIMMVTGGTGGTCLVPASTRCGVFLGGNGGSITLQPGSAGSPHGRPGNISLATTGGNVGIGESSPANTLEVKIGGTTLADAWSVRSSMRFKTNIHPLQGALQKIAELQGVSYIRKNDGNPEIGLVAEEVDKVVPEVVSREPGTNEVQGVDYSRLVALLIEAMKAQQTEIQELRARVEGLTTKARE